MKLITNKTKQKTQKKNYVNMQQRIKRKLIKE